MSAQVSQISDHTPDKDIKEIGVMELHPRDNKESFTGMT